MRFPLKLFLHNIYNPSGNIDFLHDSPCKLILHCLSALSNYIILSNVGRHADHCAGLSIYLDCDLNLVILHGFLIALRPLGMEYTVRSSKLAPEFLADMRREGRKQGNKGL